MEDMCGLYTSQQMGANRPPSEGVEYRLGSSIIKTAFPKRKHEPAEEWSIDLAGPFRQINTAAPTLSESSLSTLSAVSSWPGLSRARKQRRQLSSVSRSVRPLGPSLGCHPASGPTMHGLRSKCVNELMAAFLRLVSSCPATAYLPRTNGTVERWIAELTGHLRCFVVGAGLKERWSEYLPLAVRILTGNATRTAGIGGAPAQIVLGNRVHLNRDLVPTQVPTPPGRGAGGRTRYHPRSNSQI